MSEIDRQIEELHGQVKKAEALQQQTREAEGIARKRRRRCLSSQQQLQVARAKVKDYQTSHWKGIVDVLMGNRQAICGSLERAYT